MPYCYGCFEKLLGHFGNAHINDVFDWMRKSVFCRLGIGAVLISFINNKLYVTVDKRQKKSCYFTHYCPDTFVTFQVTFF
jgi:hypothetical protein